MTSNSTLREQLGAARRGDQSAFRSHDDAWLWRDAEQAAWALEDVSAEEKLVALALVRARGDVDQAAAMCGEVGEERARRHATILVALGHARRDGQRVLIRTRHERAAVTGR